jgi:tetratricopeptide (TPR) repeat protein
MLDSPHYRVVSSLGEEETRFLARDLELFHAGVAYILGGDLPNPPKKAVVYAFDGRGITRPFDVRGASGYFLPTLSGPVLVLRTGGGFTGDVTPEMLHEYTHFLVRQSDKRRPLWYEEGISQMSSTIRPRGGHARVAPPRHDHVRTLRDWTRASVDPTLDMANLTRATIRNRERFIAESWALAHYATLAPASRQGPERPFARFRHALDNGAQPAQAARIALGSRGEVLAQQVRDYVSQKSLTFATVVPRDGWEPSDVDIRSLTPADARRVLGLISLELGRARNAARYFQMLPGDDSRRWVGLAGAYRTADTLDKALTNIERALDATPDDASTQLEAGRVFQALAEASPTDRSANLTRARRAYSEAARLDPELAAALALDASSYLIEGEDPAKGLPLVTQAYRMLPGSLEIQLLFAQLEAARGKRAPARLHAADVASRGHGLHIEDDALELIETLK